jgi:hypothetical protein
MSRWLPRTHAVSTPVDRRAGGDRILSGASNRRGHRHGHRHRPGQLCRTPAVRERSFRKQRTVNPLMVPARYNFLYSSFQAAHCGQPLCGRPRPPTAGWRGARISRLRAARPRRPLGHTSTRSAPRRRGSTSRFARGVLETCTKTRTGRFRWLVGNSTRPVWCRAAEKVHPAILTMTPHSTTFLVPSLDTIRSAC